MVKVALPIALHLVLTGVLQTPQSGFCKVNRAHRSLVLKSAILGAVDDLRLGDCSHLDSHDRQTTTGRQTTTKTAYWGGEKALAAVFLPNQATEE